MDQQNKRIVSEATSSTKVIGNWFWLGFGFGFYGIRLRFAFLFGLPEFWILSVGCTWNLLLIVTVHMDMTASLCVCVCVWAWVSYLRRFLAGNAGEVNVVAFWYAYEICYDMLRMKDASSSSYRQHLHGAQILALANWELLPLGIVFCNPFYAFEWTICKVQLAEAVDEPAPCPCHGSRLSAVSLA